MRNLKYVLLKQYLTPGLQNRTAMFVGTRVVNHDLCKVPLFFTGIPAIQCW